jgi:hypothetical protein
VRVKRGPVEGGGTTVAAMKIGRGRSGSDNEEDGEAAMR